MENPDRSNCDSLIRGRNRVRNTYAPTMESEVLQRRVQRHDRRTYGQVRNCGVVKGGPVENRSHRPGRRYSQCRQNHSPRIRLCKSVTRRFIVSNQMPVAVGLYLVIVAAFPASLLFERSTAQSLFREDGVVESLGALAFLIASIAFVVARFRLPAPAEARSWLVRYQVFHLVLATLMFLAFAKEISWGQRIFGWQSPDALAEINTQGETNIHNLKWFQTNDESTFWERFTNFNRLFAIFCLGFGIVLPLCARFPPASRRFANVSAFRSCRCGLGSASRSPMSRSI